MAIEKSDYSDAIVAHFNAFKNQHIEVPEWEVEEKPVTLFFNPLTVQERIDLSKYDDDFMVRVLIKKALKPDGTKAFTLADLPTLLHQTSPAVITRVANRILNADLVDPALLGEFSPTGAKTES